MYMQMLCCKNRDLGFDNRGVERRPTPSPPLPSCSPKLPSCSAQLPSCQEGPARVVSRCWSPNSGGDKTGFEDVGWRSGHVTELLQQIPVCRSHRILQKYGCSHTRRFYHS